MHVRIGILTFFACLAFRAQAETSRIGAHPAAGSNVLYAENTPTTRQVGVETVHRADLLITVYTPMPGRRRSRFWI